MNSPKSPQSPHEISIVEKPVEPRAKKSIAAPIIVGALVGLIAFLLGRRSAPPLAPAEPVAAQTSESAEETPAEGAIQTVQFDDESARLAGIVVRPVSVSSLQTGVPFNGQIASDPNGVARVASLVPGRVTRLNVSQGDRVTQGQVLAVVESRAIGEAQSAYAQAVARFNNAQSNLSVITKQANAGVFSRAPVETARRAQVEAQADVSAQETAVRQTRVTLDNVQRQAKLGSYANPALEAARGQSAAAKEALASAQSALSNARASVQSANSELARRRQLAASGAYVSRPVQESQRVLVAAQSARAAAQSEVATTRANLARAKSLTAEGLVSQRDVEAAQQAFDTATARLETAQSDETTANQELARQRQLASSNVAGNAEVGAAQGALASAQSDAATREAEVRRARESVKLADIALNRESATAGTKHCQSPRAFGRAGRRRKRAHRARKSASNAPSRQLCLRA